MKLPHKDHESALLNELWRITDMLARDDAKAAGGAAAQNIVQQIALMAMAVEDNAIAIDRPWLCEKRRPLVLHEHLALSWLRSFCKTIQLQTNW